MRSWPCPCSSGRKTERERFAGADATYTLEGMMGDGKALQMGTSHELGQNFAKAFDITFQSSAGASEYAWQTSWGVSTRLIGALIMGHGDDAGLRVPPALAPIQAVVVLVRDEEGAGERAATLAAELAGSGVRVRFDDRVETGFGRRAVEWELKGVPVRIEVGPRDLAAGTVTLVRRDVAGEKATVPLEGLGHRVRDLLGRDPDVALPAGARPAGGGDGRRRRPRRGPGSGPDGVRPGALGPDPGLRDRPGRRRPHRPLPPDGRRRRPPAHRASPG